MYIQQNVRSAIAEYFSDTHFASKSVKRDEDDVLGFMTAQPERCFAVGNRKDIPGMKIVSQTNTHNEAKMSSSDYVTCNLCMPLKLPWQSKYNSNKIFICMNQLYTVFILHRNFILTIIIALPENLFIFLSYIKYF